MDTDKGGRDRNNRGPNLALIGLVIVVVIAVAGVLVYFAMQTMAERPTPIGDIHADMRRYDGSVVSVRGTVGNVINMLGMLKMYEVTDDTGSIWVVTERGLPQDGSTETVSGLVQEVFNFNGTNYTVIREPSVDP